MHDAEPGVAANVPARQSVHNPVVDVCPVAQFIHDARDVEPVAAVVFPGGHVLIVIPSAEY